MRADLVEELPRHLAENVRRAREQRSLTQQQLSRLAGVPRSTLAHLETGGANPTLVVLSRLALALQLSIEELLSPPRARCELFRKGTLPIREGGRSPAARVQSLLPHALPGMEIDRLELPVHARLAGVPHAPGTHEYLCCERGRLTLHVAGARLELEEGDVAAFAGDQAHSYENRGRVPAVGFSVVALTGALTAAGGPPRRGATTPG